MSDRQRCSWAGDDPLYQKYHDEEWGTPSHDDRHLFEMLILEGAQAGLSWITILRRREGYRIAFHGFDPRKVAGFSQADVDRLLSDTGIIRNRAKVGAAIQNAKAFLRVQKEFGSFANYMWGFVDGMQIVNDWNDLGQMPAETELSRHISKDLKKRGFSFVGPTIIYSYLQAIGIIDDHVKHCFRKMR